MSEMSPHPKFPCILICSDGKIFSRKTKKERTLWKTRHGYLQISVGRTSYLVHRLVADVFVKNPNNKPEVNHKNGIKHDNRSINLGWVTRRENIIHARDILGVKYSLSGFDSNSSKITKNDIPIMIRLFKLGLTIKEIAYAFNVNRVTIGYHLNENRIKRNKTNTNKPNNPKRAQSEQAQPRSNRQTVQDNTI